jgi:hypothetical protein
VEGEVGVLKDVKTHDRMSANCFLYIEHRNATFIGRVLCDSVEACQTLVRILRTHLNEPLEMIGRLALQSEPSGDVEQSAFAQ